MKRFVCVFLVFLLLAAGCQRDREREDSIPSEQEQEEESGLISLSSEGPEEELPVSEEPEESEELEESSASEADIEESESGQPSAVPEQSSVPEPPPQAQPAPSSSEELPLAEAPQEMQKKSTAESEPGFLASVENDVVALINQERTALGLAKLQYDRDLNRAARIRSKELYLGGHFDHTRPDGRSWISVLQEDVPMAYVFSGENLARVEHNMADYDPAKDASYWYQTWENSPGHYENMVRASFTHVGVGIYYTTKNGMIYGYATTVFTSYE